MDSFCHKKKQGIDLLPSGMRMIIGHLAIMAIMAKQGIHSRELAKKLC
jgi:hypothetical protein